MDKELLTVIYYAITSILLWTDITRLLLPYKLTALLIQSVKEQQVIIDNLKSRIETLEG